MYGALGVCAGHSFSYVHTHIMHSMLLKIWLNSFLFSSLVFLARFWLPFPPPDCVNHRFASHAPSRVPFAPNNIMYCCILYIEYSLFSLQVACTHTHIHNDWIVLKLCVRVSPFLLLLLLRFKILKKLQKKISPSLFSSLFSIVTWRRRRCISFLSCRFDLRQRGGQGQGERWHTHRWYWNWRSGKWEKGAFVRIAAILWAKPRLCVVRLHHVLVVVVVIFNIFSFRPSARARCRCSHFFFNSFKNIIFKSENAITFTVRLRARASPQF